jgi:hypothetical protein
MFFIKISSTNLSDVKFVIIFEINIIKNLEWHYNYLSNITDSAGHLWKIGTFIACKI